MKKLKGQNLLQLMLYLHNRIDESVEWTFNSIDNGMIKEMISYPLDAELTDDEIIALKIISKDEKLKKPLMKIMKNAAMYPLFDFFNFIDGSGDIPDANYEWIELIECSEEEVEKLEDREDFLHDYFFETYWEWKDSKDEQEK